MKHIARKTSAILVLMSLISSFIPSHVVAGSWDEVIYPLKKISKLECRFEDFENLSSSCIQDLPILHTKDYAKYATKNGGYNDYTRLYTVLWGASYKYGWDVWSGGHQWVDIATAKWTPVYSMADGKVIESKSAIGWGKLVSIEHSINGKKIISNYAHLSKISVEKWDRVKVGEKIGEVGSTGNSTGNHLHFQLDLPSKFHPYYYDWNACPHSYYDITEKGVCFDELSKNTFDPLAFLESNGAIMNNRVVQTPKKAVSHTDNKNTSRVLPNIFNTTVYHGYGTKSDVEALQKLMKEMGYYNGSINGDFADIEEAIIQFQLKTGVLWNRDEDGAGWFGPKTRKMAKKIYQKQDNEDDDRPYRTVPVTQSKAVTTEVKKVSRVNLMTREEREAKEMEEFLNSYTPEVINTFSQLQVNETKTAVFSVKNKKGKGFRGNTPGKVTFSYDTTKIRIFPESFFNFTDGERELQITGLKTGNASVEVKIGEVLVKTLSISVGKKWEKPRVESAKIYADSSITIGEKKTGIIMMRDQYSNKLIKSPFRGTFTLGSKSNTQYCVKRGNLEDIREIYARKCFESEYKDSITFDYSDTIGGLLIFDYKSLDSYASIDVKSKGKNVSKKDIAVTQPKSLTQNYVYYDDVIQSLMNGVTDGINKGHFMQDSIISERDAKNWITQAIKQTGKDVPSEFKDIQASRYKKVSRISFLEMLELAVENNSYSGSSREYKDMKPKQQELVAKILWSQYSWKDTFGKDYYQPEKKLSRWEAAYALMSLIKKENGGQLARK